VVKAGDWKALAWQLERAWPRDFGRPEVQIGVAVQNNVNTNGGNGDIFQLAVLKDVEFLGLKNHEGYEYHENQADVREIEAEVEPELTGHLVKKGVTGAAVISESEAERIKRRLQAADDRVDKFLSGRQSKRGNGDDGHLAAEVT
jgi:hypothetical protein